MLDNPTRRMFLQASASTAALMAASQGVSQESGSTPTLMDGAMDKRKRPNILWIQTDEQRPDSLGCYGSSWARTPNLDQLASQGTAFTECHVQSPVCVPSRTSMLFCQYPMKMNCYENSGQFRDGLLDPELPTFVNLFERAGYNTVSYGKWHTANHPTWKENTLFHIFDKVTGYYGLTPPYSEEVYKVIKCPGLWSIILAGEYPYHDWGVNMSSHITDWGIRWLHENGNSAQPWLLRISHIWPHTPVLVPPPWNTMYAPGEVPCNALNREAYETRASFDRWFADQQKCFDLSMEQWRRICADYYALCNYVDYEVGRLLRALKDMGLAENTIVAFNSDHGRSNGETGLCQKGTYDREVWRAPFLLAGPGIPRGEVRNDICELMDFGPTLGALCGVEMAPGMLGRNLFDSEKPEAVYGIIDLNPYRRAGVRTERYRFDCTLRYESQDVPQEKADPNLFDVIDDPAETRNLANDPGNKNLIDRHCALLRDWYSRNG